MNVKYKCWNILFNSTNNKGVIASVSCSSFHKGFCRVKGPLSVAMTLLQCNKINALLMSLWQQGLVRIHCVRHWFTNWIYFTGVYSNIGLLASGKRKLSANLLQCVVDVQGLVHSLQLEEQILSYIGPSLGMSYTQYKEIENC